MNQKQTPWGLIWTAIAVVAFAAVVVTFVVITVNNKKDPVAESGSKVDQCSESKGPSSYLNENVCASKIKGIVFQAEPDRSHVFKAVTYDHSPPIGGNHSAVWADCDGTVYDAAIANENAVHMLEHGAVWITYNADTIKAGDLAILKKLVDGQPRMALSPYPDLDSPISLQSWGYQLKVDSASDARVKDFIAILRYNPRPRRSTARSARIRSSNSTRAPSGTRSSTDMTLTESDPAPPAPTARPRVAVAMIAVIAVCLAIVAVAGGYLWGASGDSGPSALPSTTSVDAGFARDMSTHHTQAVTMAGYERDNTSDSALKLLAYDIETGQQFQIGQMAGWLDAWGLSRSTDAAQMAWMTADHMMHMDSDGLMPGHGDHGRDHRAACRRTARRWTSCSCS